jgi:hypothetical protein
MADKYLVLQAGDTAINWNGGSRWFEADLTTPVTDPTADDNVYMGASAFPSASQSLVVNSTANCLSMDWTGATNTPTFTISSAMKVYGNMTFIAAMVLNGAGGLNYLGTCSLTTNGLTLGNGVLAPYIGSASETLTLLDDLNMTGTFAPSGGGLTTNNHNVTSGAFSIVGVSVKTITLGSSTINCASWSYSGSNLTVTANTATINISGTGVFVGGNIATYNNINLNGTAHTVSGAFTCATLTRNGTATKTDTVTFTSGATLTCTTFAMIGNSITNRLLVQSSTIGSPATITATNWTGTANVDIMDITATNAVDLSAITGGSGDCQGNTNITFTTAASQISAANGNASTLATWQDGVGTDRVPLPQDDWTCSHNLTMDMPRIGKSITFTGTLTITTSIGTSNYGSLTLASGVTINSLDIIHYLRGRGIYSFTSAGKDINSIYLIAPGGAYTFIDGYTTARNIIIFNGSGILASGTSYQANAFIISNTTVKSLTTDSNIITCLSLWRAYSDGTTFTSTGLTIIMSGSNATARSFEGGDLTYNDVVVKGAGGYALTVTGNNTFNSFKVDRSQAAKEIIATGTTQAVSSMSIPVSGTRTVTFTGGTWIMTVNKLVTDYLVVTNSIATINHFYAGTHSTNGGGNTGWIFGNPSSAQGGLINDLVAMGII